MNKLFLVLLFFFSSSLTYSYEAFRTKAPSFILTGGVIVLQDAVGPKISINYESSIGSMFHQWYLSHLGMRCIGNFGVGINLGAVYIPFNGSVVGIDVLGNISYYFDFGFFYIPPFTRNGTEFFLRDSPIGSYVELGYKNTTGISASLKLRKNLRLTASTSYDFFIGDLVRYSGVNVSFGVDVSF